MSCQVVLCARHRNTSIDVLVLVDGAVVSKHVAVVCVRFLVLLLCVVGKCDQLHE